MGTQICPSTLSSRKIVYRKSGFSLGLCEYMHAFVYAAPSTISSLGWPKKSDSARICRLHCRIFVSVSYYTSECRISNRRVFILNVNKAIKYSKTSWEPPKSKQIPLPPFVIRGDVPRPLPEGTVSWVSAQWAQCNEIISDGWPSTNDVITLSASCGAVYCNLSCLWVCGCGCLFVGLLPR